MVLKTLLASGVSTFFIKGKPAFSNGTKSLSRTPPDFTILCNWFFYAIDNFILVDELFAKNLLSLETCALVNNNLCGKFVSSLDSVPLCIPDLY